MSITDELRVYTEKQIKWVDMTKVHYRELFRIADRIDEAHQHAIAYVDDRDPETMAEHGWVKLPVDADGEYIHIGDSVEIIGGEYGTAVAIELCEDGGWNVSMRPTGWDTPTLFAAESVHHYHPPTVEDILMEFHERMDELGTTDQCVGIDRADAVDALLRERAELVAEYAKRLRLVGDAE